MRKLIEVKVCIKADIELVWQCFTEPKHIVNWYSLVDGWHTPRAVNDLRENGSFFYRMESKDGSMGFDLRGTNVKVVKYQLIKYLLEDGRRVDVKFKAEDGRVTLSEDVEAESNGTIDIEKNSWQSILNKFKNYVEDLQN